jgi:ADP-heptose:LPS heptosyltransferase
MKLSTMRRIDAVVGRPVCFGLSVFFALFGRLLRRGPKAGQRRVLFIELSEMGSTILASPAMRRVRERNPDRPPCFVIFEKNAASLRLLDLFDERDIFTLRDRSLVSMAVDVVRFVAFCRSRDVDTAVDLELFSRISAILGFLSCAGTRVGFDNFEAEGLYRGRPLTHRVQYNPYVHMSQNFLALVEALDLDPRDVPLVKRAIPLPEMTSRVPIKPAEHAYVRAELAKHVDPSRPARLVLINHDAGKLLPIRTWPATRFAELARRLLALDPEIHVVLVGIPDAAASAREIVRAVGSERCVDFVGRTRTLDDLVQLFHQSELLITNDSGPAHFASLTGIASITLFGPETARLYRPTGPRAVAIDKQIACSPCLTAFNHRNSICRDNQCLAAISVDEVFEHARRLLDAPARAAHS